MTTEFKVWCDPVFRENTRKLIVCKGDVTAALEWYKGKFGCLPVKIGLSPVNQYHAEEVPAGIDIFYMAGILSWEIWFSWEKKTEEKLPERKTDPPDPLGISPDLTKSNPDGITPRNHEILHPLCNITPVINPEKTKIPKKNGRPIKYGEVSRMTLWRRAKKIKEQERLL